MFQVVSGVVLAQTAQSVPDLAARQDDFQTERQVTRVPVAQDLYSAGVGGQVAADLAASLGRQ